MYHCLKVIFFIPNDEESEIVDSDLILIELEPDTITAMYQFILALSDNPNGITMEANMDMINEGIVSVALIFGK